MKPDGFLMCTVVHRDLPENHSTLSSSTSKTRVAFGGIVQNSVKAYWQLITTLSHSQNVFIPQFLQSSHTLHQELKCSPITWNCKFPFSILFWLLTRCYPHLLASASACSSAHSYRMISLACKALSSKPAGCCRSMGQTDGCPTVT